MKRRGRPAKNTKQSKRHYKGGVVSPDGTYLENKLILDKLNSPKNDEESKAFAKAHASEVGTRKKYNDTVEIKQDLEVEKGKAEIKQIAAQAELSQAQTKSENLQKSKIYRDVWSENTQWYLGQAYFVAALAVTSVLKVLNLPFKALNSKAAIGVGSAAYGAIGSTVGSTVGEFIKVAMPYFVLGLIICIILGIAISRSQGGSGGGGGGGGGGGSGNWGSSGGAVWWNPISWGDSPIVFPSFSGVELPKETAWIKFPASWKVMMRQLTGTPPPGLARKGVDSGRCDETHYHEYASSNGVKLCGKTSIDFPDDIVYTLTTEDITAITANPNITTSLKQCVSNPTQKVNSIRIPYKLNAAKDSFIPACNLATFDNGESAAKLFDHTKESESVCQFAGKQ